ncbi:MAG: LysM peptidoglycan-binding domain-containing protein, partial [Paramuribaculum sp.]|nr:LysM peptidoglycan-binding domain-containing protein [Paramuribaculum sp.]
ESAINPNAVSRAGATGLWQFMPATAKGLGMEVSSLVDERRDARESSRNAARYLKQLYNIYGDWSLAIAAYNCGPGNVNKARRRAGDANSDFWEIYNFLPSETRGYVPAFIAANFVMNYHDDYGIHRPVIKRPLITDTVEVRERVHFNQIANVLNIPIDEIRMLNPQYRKDVIPGSPTRPYLLTLPSQQVLSYISSRDDILAYESDKYTPRSTVSIGPNKKKEEPAETPEQNQPAEEVPAKPVEPDKNTMLADQVTRTTHTVGRGEDLGSIAKHYGVSATDIKHWNNLRRGKVREGDQLVIELRQRNTVAAVNTRQKSSAASAQPEVPARQTKARTTTTTNNYQTVPERNTTRKTTSRSTVPQRNSEKYKNKKQTAAKKTKKPQKPVEHTVKSGESLEKIAKRNGTTVDALRKANGMKKNATMLQPGQKLKIPKKTAEKQTANKSKNTKQTSSKNSKPANSKSQKGSKKKK